MYKLTKTWLVRGEANTFVNRPVLETRQKILRLLFLLYDAVSLLFAGSGMKCVAYAPNHEFY